MVWIDARANVATMKHEQLSGLDAIRQPVRPSMGTVSLAFGVHLPVSDAIHRAMPQPAAVRFFDVSPESLLPRQPTTANQF
jgi:hypothetical protein